MRAQLRKKYDEKDLPQGRPFCINVILEGEAR
jgi:hypothetical protein